MLINKLLQLGFVQGVDYSIAGEVITALPKIRMIDQEVQHEAVEAVTEEQEILDEQGMPLDPPQFQTLEISPAIAAYTETIQVEETYYESLPLVDDLKSSIVKDQDVAMLINEFLKGKQIADDDSINIEMFVKGQGGWNFQHIAPPSMSELYDLIVPVNNSMSQKAINEQARKLLADSDWKVLRHSDQLAMNIPTSMSELEFQALLLERQQARDSIVE